MSSKQLLVFFHYRKKKEEDKSESLSISVIKKLKAKTFLVAADTFNLHESEIY